MDPMQNVERQLEIASEILDKDKWEGGFEQSANALADLGEELATLVEALDEWRKKGGFDPYSGSKAIINELIIRDPDYENYVVTDAAENSVEVHTVEIDIGGQWTDYKYFASDLADGDGMAEEYEQNVLEEIKHLPEDNIVRREAEEFFATARQHGKR